MAIVGIIMMLIGTNAGLIAIYFTLNEILQELRNASRHAGQLDEEIEQPPGQ